MFTLALSIGIYSYLVLLIGFFGLLYKQIIIAGTIIYVFGFIFFLRKKFGIQNFRNKMICFEKKCTKLRIIFLLLILFQALVNLAGVLGPELGFDALWYHLTLPKIYLQNHSIFYVPGGLLYYSAMPKLAETLYIVGLAFGNEIFVKLIHFFFGILSLFALYKLSRKFLPINLSLLVLILFYSNLVVGWMSITSYIELARTFFEIMSLWGFINWTEKREKKWLTISALLLGLAISTKLLALGSLLIFAVLIVISTRKIINALIYCLLALFIPLPWFIFSFANTGNLVYPFFTSNYPVRLDFNLINPLHLSNPISPLYVIFLPIALFFYKEFKTGLKTISLYTFFATAVWYLTPHTGGGRFMLPYLPAFSLVTVVIIGMLKRTELRYTFICLIIVFSLFSIFYRAVANAKYIPYILGKESKSQFLTNHLNFSFGDFYDTDGYFGKKIEKGDTVLLYGFHNLYYVNFRFIDSSYVKEGDVFNYIAVQGSNLPVRFRNWNKIYYNDTTNVGLYSAEGLKWIF